jgi:hypothetical protein
MPRKNAALPFCHRDRSEAKWRDLRFTARTTNAKESATLPICHPDRSEAKWRDLRFTARTTDAKESATLPLFVIPTGA